MKVCIRAPAPLLNPLNYRNNCAGPAIPRPGLWNLLVAIAYLGHWFVVIPWVTLKMAVLPKRLVWAKTSYGELSEQLS